MAVTVTPDRRSTFFSAYQSAVCTKAESRESLPSRYPLDSGGRSYGSSGSEPTSTISPSKPSARRVSAALAPARLAPAITKVGMGLRLRLAGRAEAVMPGYGRRVGEARDLVDDDAAAFGVRSGRLPGRAQHRIEGLRRAALHGEGQLGQELAFPGLRLDDSGPGHHVARGDPLQQRALQPLLPWHKQVRGVPVEGVVGRREVGVLGG